MKFTSKACLLSAAMAAAVLAGCASHSPANAPSSASDSSPYLIKPDYDHAMVCDLRYDDMAKCEATLKSLCGARGFLDMRIRPLREQGAAAAGNYRMLQLQCKPRPDKP